MTFKEEYELIEQLKREYLKTNTELSYKEWLRQEGLLKNKKRYKKNKEMLNDKK